MGIPGWPEFAFCTPSIESVLIVLAQSLASFVLAMNGILKLVGGEVESKIQKDDCRLKNKNAIQCKYIKKAPSLDGAL